MDVEIPDGRSLSDEVLESLRLRALHARELGYPVVDIAAILDVREETVSRWCVKYEQGGEASLPGDRTGRPVGAGRLLDAEQEQTIQRFIDTKTPQELGIPSALWTRAAVAELIEQQTGQRMPIRTVGEYLNRWGYTPQKPVRKAYKQVPEKVAEWLEAGARMVWVVSPRLHTVTVYRSLTEIVTLTAKDKLDGGEVVPGFEINVAEIFG